MGTVSSQCLWDRKSLWRHDLRLTVQGVPAWGSPAQREMQCGPGPGQRSQDCEAELSPRQPPGPESCMAWPRLHSVLLLGFRGPQGNWVPMASEAANQLLSPGPKLPSLGDDNSFNKVCTTEGGGPVGSPCGENGETGG